MLLHVIERAWHIPKARVGGAALLLAAGATLVGGLWANRFSVVETEIALPDLARDVVAMQVSDIHVGRPTAHAQPPRRPQGRGRTRESNAVV